jgi:sulfur carrier protein ThiS
MTRPTYSLEDLSIAVAFTTTMTELLEHLGLEPTSRKRSSMWARISHYGLDTSHWRRSRKRQLYRSEDLARAVASSTSVAGVLRQLGIRPAGGSHHYISSRIRDEGLDTTHFTGPGHNRGKAGPRRSAAEILVVLPPGSRRAGHPLLKRAMLESGVPHQCALCGLGPEWHGRPLTLAIDHVNGEWLDNRLDNLRFLCPNCHAQTATWCRRKGS